MVLPASEYACSRSSSVVVGVGGRAVPPPAPWEGRSVLVVRRVCVVGHLRGIYVGGNQ